MAHDKHQMAAAGRAQPKKHHYVPRLLLRNFIGADGMLWTYSKRAPDAGVRRSRPEGVFFENNLYSSREGDEEWDAGLELEYAALEDAVAPVVAKLREAAIKGIRPGLLAEERVSWDAFFVAQMKRTPDFTKQARFDEDYRRVLEEIVEDVAKELSITAEEKQSFLEKADTKSFRQKIKVDALSRESPEAQHFVGQMALVAAHVGLANRSFAIGSYPAIKARQFNLMGRPEAETWLPIAPDVCICMVFGKKGEYVVKISDDSAIKAINSESFSASTSICSSSEALCKSLVRAHRHHG